MKRTLMILLGVLGIFLLTACSTNDADRAARDLAPKAFQALQDDVGNNIRVREVDYACFVTESGDAIGKSCLYAIVYTAGSSTRLYALVGAYEDPGLPTTAHANLLPDESYYNEYRTQILSDQYKSNIERELNADDTVDSFTYARGDLSPRQISNLMDKVS